MTYLSKCEQRDASNVLREWLSTQDSFVQMTVIDWREKLMLRSKNMGEYSADELILKTLLFIGGKNGMVKKPRNVSARTVHTV